MSAPTPPGAGRGRGDETVIATIYAAPYDIAPFASRWGYVYLVHSSQDVFKIGRTNDLDRRLKQLRQEHGDHLRLICAVEVVDMCDIETRLHQHFTDSRLDGEWFRLSDQGLKEFCIYISVYAMQARVEATLDARVELSNEDAMYKPLAFEIDGRRIDGRL